MSGLKFQKEREFFNTNVKEWLVAHRNEFVLIKDDRLVGFYHSFEEAFAAGLKSFGTTEDFFIEEILEHQPINFLYVADYAYSC